MTVASTKRINPMLTTIVNYALAATIILHNVHSAPLSEAVITDWAQYDIRDMEGAGTYSFRYDIEDPQTNNIQFRSEERHRNGSVIGSYGYLEADGNIHMVHYVADERGYRATVENSARSGMLKPIPVLDDIDYTAYGYTPQMIAALKSQKAYNENQVVHEQRIRPIDRQNVEKAMEFQREKHQNQLTKESSSLQGESTNLQARLQYPTSQNSHAGYRYFNYGNAV